MTYRRIKTVDDLPLPGDLDERARERIDIDFKRHGEDMKIAKTSKHIAGFSNQLGGSLVFGGDCESDKTRLSYPGIPAGKFGDVIDHCQKAANMCSPAQVVDVFKLVGPEGTDLVIVNVDPFIDQLVACPAYSKKDGTTVADGWKFPIRRGSMTDYIAPENLAMYMNRKTRSAYVLLSQIPEDKNPNVRLYHRRDPTESPSLSPGPKIRLGKIELLGPTRNVAVFTCEGKAVWIPLADVVNVWPDQDGIWVVKVNGAMPGSNQSIRYVPLVEPGDEVSWPATALSGLRGVSHPCRCDAQERAFRAFGALRRARDARGARGGR